MAEAEQSTRRFGRVTRLALTVVLLAPLAATASLFIWTEEGQAVAVDTALSLGLGSDVDGTVRYQGCAFYVDGAYPGSKAIDRSTRCEMIIEAEGERAVRPIDLDHPEALAEVRQPGRVFGTLGAAMPAGILFDRLGRFGTLILISLVCLGGLIYAAWPRRRGTSAGRCVEVGALRQERIEPWPSRKPSSGAPKPARGRRSRRSKKCSTGPRSWAVPSSSCWSISPSR